MYQKDPPGAPSSPTAVAKSNPAPATGSSSRIRSWFQPPKLPFLMSPIALVALGISAYMTYVGLTGSEIAGCGGGGTFSCDHVLTSRWSKVFGIPVGLPAMGMYVGLVLVLATLASGVTGTLKKWGWAITGVMTASAAFAAIWFIGLQVFVIGHLCPYCLGAHTCGLVLFGLFVFAYRPAKQSLLGSAGISALG